MRRIILIAIIFLVAVGIFFVVRGLTSAPAVQDQPAGNGDAVGLTPQGSGQDGTNGAEPVARTSRAIMSYWVDAADRTVYYITTEGQLYRIPPSGTEERLSLSLESVSAVYPSPKTPEAIVAAGANTAFYSVINPVTGNRTFLPRDTIAAAWSPDAKSIAVLRSPSVPDSRTPAGLYLVSLPRYNVSLLAPLTILDPVMRWVNQSEILVGSAADPSITTPWFAYSTSARTFRSLGLPPYQAAHINTLTKDYFLFTGGQARGELASGLFGTARSTVTPLTFVTLPEKCIASGGMLYCAVLNPAPLTADKLRSYLQRGWYSSDRIIRRPLAGNSPSNIVFNSVWSDTAFDAKDLTVIGSTLLFINKYDNKLYSLALEQ